MIKTPVISIITAWVLVALDARAIELWADQGLPVRAGLELWLDCSHQNAGRVALQLAPLIDRDGVDFLLDSGGQARHLDQPSANARPRFRQTSQGTFLSFNGTNNFLIISHLGVRLTNVTVFVVAAPNRNAGVFRAFFSLNQTGVNDYRSGLNLDFGPEAGSTLAFINAEGSGCEGAAQLLRDPPMSFGGWHLFDLESQPGPQAVRLRMDGRDQSARDRHLSGIHLDELLLGARHYSNVGGSPYAQGFFSGYFAEFLLFNRLLSPAETTTLEGYLGKKYRDWLRLSPAEPNASVTSGAGDGSDEAGLRPAPLEIKGEPPPRPRSEFEAILRASGSNTNSQGNLPVFRVVLCAGPKDHGPSEHDYPLWQKRWARLLSLGEKVSLSTAWEWPSAEQWSKANVIAFYSDNPGWSRARAADLDAFLSRGGGLVFIHYAVDGHDEVEALAQRIGLAWRGGFSKFRHGPLDLKFETSPLATGFGTTHFVDESYWNLVGNLDGAQVVATGLEEGEPRPLFWTRSQGQGRVFVSIPGHYTWTFDDPLFRLLILRGICWAGGQPMDRLAPLALVGAQVTK
jgi:hypothetical protein